MSDLTPIKMNSKQGAKIAHLTHLIGSLIAISEPNDVISAFTLVMAGNLSSVPEDDFERRLGSLNDSIRANRAQLQKNAGGHANG